MTPREARILSVEVVTGPYVEVLTGRPYDVIALLEAEDIDQLARMTTSLVVRL